MKKYKILIIIASLVLFLTVALSSAFAYYQNHSSQATTIGTNINDDNTIEIASFGDLFANSKASKYNDDAQVSTLSTRKILKLTDDITLADDLIITADVQLDLNDNTLNLNNKKLIIRNGYAGCYSIYDGTILTGGTGTITIDLINGGFIADSLTFKETEDGEEISSTDVISTSNINPKYTAYSALYFVSNSFVSDLNIRPRFEDYVTVSDVNFDLEADKFISSKKCSYYSNNSELCSFVYKDLDLPKHYLSSDIEITYNTHDSLYLTNEGDVTLPNDKADVTLTVTISSPSWNNTTFTCDFKLHIINLSNTTVKTAVGNILINSFLSEYYIGHSLVIKEQVILPDYYYEFNHSAELPLTALDGNITFSYSTTNLAGTAVSTTSHPENGIYMFEPNENCYHIIVSVNNTANSPLNMYTTYVGDYETIARLIINDLYGGSIVYDASTSQTELHTYANLEADLSSSTLYDYVEDYQISNMTYAITSGSDVENAYTLSNNVLSVVNGVVPDAKMSSVTVTFTFGIGSSAQTIDIDLYVDYLAKSGDTIAGFLRYYNIFETSVESELITEFRMPFSFNNGTPYVCYDFSINYTLEQTGNDFGESIAYYDYTLSVPSSLQVILFYNNTEHAMNLTNYTQSLTNQLDKTQFETIAAYGDAEWIFRLNPEGATTENVEVLLIYNYLFNTGDNWSRYEYVANDTSDLEHQFVTELTSSMFEVKGGLFYKTSSTATNAVHSNYFFAWIYNNFNPSKYDNDFTPLVYSSVDGTKFIPLDWLGLDVNLDNTEDAYLSNVTDYSGIGYLNKISTINLVNPSTTLSASILTSIASMDSVTTLNLVGCGLTDITTISSMTNVKSLNISNNIIKDFSKLINMTSLEEVILHTNEASSAIYGSNGVINYQTYEDLMRNGISVYNLVSGGIPVLYADSDQQTDYSKLKAIAYQNKLSTSKNISLLYANFSTSYSAYGLSNFKATVNWSYESGKTETTATYFQASVTSGGYTLIVKFYVDRYTAQ